MLIRKTAVVVTIVLLLLALPAAALDTTNLLATTAMPLAVAAAADLPRVQSADLIDLVTRLNDANVPPVEFVQIVRYVPVALIDQTGRPQIVEYVTTETRRGITGSALASSIATELRTRYDVPRFDLTPAQPVYVTTEIVPSVVEDRANTNLVSLVAMPLAVAALSDLAGVPQRDVVDLVAQLNEANVAPAQFVEVMNTAPVALVEPRTSRPFVQYVTTQVSSGVRGPALTTAVTEHLRSRGTRINVAQVEPVAPVQHIHPHGGPPGQLKKIYGFKTGAEVVHGVQPPGLAKKQVVIVQQREHGHGHGNGHGRGHDRQQVIAPQPMFVPQPMYSSGGPPEGKGHGNPHGGPPGNPGHGNGHGKGKG